MRDIMTSYILDTTAKSTPRKLYLTKIIYNYQYHIKKGGAQENMLFKECVSLHHPRNAGKFSIEIETIVFS